MKKRYKTLAISTAVLMLGILATNLVMGATLISNNLSPTKPIAPTISTDPPTTNDGMAIPADPVVCEEELKARVPKTLEVAEIKIHPVRTRYLMYTRDGCHIMWGIYGNGHFTGTDNLGKRCWGIYERGIFAGLYDGTFFWGKYLDGAWKAQHLFGLPSSTGRYVVFPPIALTDEDQPIP